MLKMEDCLFCQIVQGKLPVHKIWQDEHFLAILDINPNAPGHTLLLPKTHHPYVFDLKEPLYSNLFAVAQKLSRPLLEVTRAKRVGLVIQGFSLPHVHLHLIPMNDPHDLDEARAKPASEPELGLMAFNIMQAISSQP
jgi:histidine triad (HIT) family protein